MLFASQLYADILHILKLTGLPVSPPPPFPRLPWRRSPPTTSCWWGGCWGTPPPTSHTIFRWVARARKGIKLSIGGTVEGQEED